ncbi:hypothetical protein [Echinicola vietnamensis]|uniref:Uncharacterized protein n=1 Tax=Echinicola vietnamensis (strain DSM 17526 / LMG 23754 / KMM 6221) TaxID=926556 RepID=L0FXU1_ECHVK|nr:hypothetical protein [Echinicola vietnamensis]AGA77873.1 hypothetical protein Echvi_1608 [Echinicola vietnamensis DSM 17526]
MIQKLFPLDKNYILRQAQSVMEEELVEVLVQELKKSYTLLYNPLGLMDNTYQQIVETQVFPKDRVRVIYEQLCGIYRFKYGSNQLEFLFDGRSHLDKYREDWKAQFTNWLRELGTHEPYVKTMLRMTVLFDTENRAEFAENRCKSFINDFFKLKIVKRKGELKLKIA